MIKVNYDTRMYRLKIERVVVVLKWSACLLSTPMIRVRVPLTHTVFLYNL